MKTLSGFFYQRTGIWQCLGLAVLMVLYASLVMGGQSACFQDQLEEGMRVLGLKRGYDLNYVQALFGAVDRTPESFPLHTSRHGLGGKLF